MVDEARIPEPGDVVADKYEIESMLGMGGMGAVFSAINKQTDKRFAIKWLLPDVSGDEQAVQRFTREARLGGRIEHANVVAVYDMGEFRGSFYMVMELLRGESLSACLKREGRIEPVRAARLMIGVLRGVDAAHRLGVVHRDLKPDNIFLSLGPEGDVARPKVLDFGISKPALDDTVSPSITKTGVVVGTPHYLSPEQIRGSKQVDARSDVYSLGVVLYQTLTGRLPYTGDTYGDLVIQIVTGNPPAVSSLVSELPSGLEELVSKAMSIDPQNRFADAESFGRALEPFAEGMTFATGQNRTISSGLPDTSEQVLPTPFATEGRAAGSPSKGSRRPVLGLVIAAALLTVLVAGIGGWLLLGGPRHRDTMASEPKPTFDRSGSSPVERTAAGSPSGAGDLPSLPTVTKVEDEEIRFKVVESESMDPGAIATPTGDPGSQTPAGSSPRPVSATGSSRASETESDADRVRRKRFEPDTRQAKPSSVSGKASARKKRKLKRTRTDQADPKTGQTPKTRPGDTSQPLGPRTGELRVEDF